MNLTRAQLREGDYSTLFTRDPGAFIEAIIVNLLWSKDQPDEALTIANQRYTFDKWLEFYTANIRQEIEQEISQHQATKEMSLYRQGYRQGQIEALTHLPIKQTMFGKQVDLTAVSNNLSLLKAQEPRGVDRNEGI